MSPALRRARELLRKLTVEPWRAIDEAHRDPSAPSWHVPCVLLTVCIAVIIERYLGGEDRYRDLGELRHLFAFIDSERLRPRVYWGLFKAINDFLLPVLCIKLLLRGRLRDHGWRWPDRNEWLWAGAVFLAVMPFVIAASYTATFQLAYPRFAGAARSLTHFFGWEGVYAFQFLMLEFFYRGFMVNALARHFGANAIFVMVVPYAMIHFNKPMAEAFASIFAGIVLGILALRSRSIFGGFAIHCGVAWSMDVLALLHRGTLQKLFAGS